MNHIGILYTHKLQSALLYKAGASKIRTFSEWIAEIFMRRARVDEIHAIMLYPLIYELKIGQVTYSPYDIQGVGEKEPTEPEQMADICHDWLGSMMIVENTAFKAAEDCPENIIERVREQVNIVSFGDISRKRIENLDKLRGMVKSGSIWQGGGRDTEWHCLYCDSEEYGSQEPPFSAPSICRCCGSDQSWFARSEFYKIF